MRALVYMIGLSAALTGATVLDRIAVIAGGHAIKASDIDRDIRLTAFLNKIPVNASASSKREAAERLITQQIIRNEVVSGGYRRPPESDAEQLEREIRRDRFGGSEQRLRETLQRYGLTEAELHAQLLWQITVLQFIDERFRDGAIVTDQDVREYYDEHFAEIHQSSPNNDGFEAMEPKIRATLEGQRIDSSFNEWLDQARKSEPVEFKPGAFDGAGVAQDRPAQRNSQ